MSVFSELIRGMIWSYSRITTFDTCPYSFYLQYILKDWKNYPTESNYWAELGIFVHEIFEKIFSNELSIDDASAYFLENYKDKVKMKQKPNVMAKAYEECAEYLATTSLEWLKDYEVVGTEIEAVIDIGGYKFKGFVDLLLKEKSTGDYIIVDHKSCKEFFSQKSGLIYKSMEHKLEEYKKQMYLYSNAVLKIYGKLPTQIWWHHFRANGYLTKIPFDKAEYDETMNWFLKTIQRIEKEEDFKEKTDYFFCNNLCNFRNSCEYRESNSKWKKGKRKKKKS